MIITSVQAIKDSIMHISDDIISVKLLYHLSCQQRIQSSYIVITPADMMEMAAVISQLATCIRSQLSLIYK